MTVGKPSDLAWLTMAVKPGVLAVVAAISIVAGYLGELQLIHRKIEHGELKMRPLIGLPINGLLKRSLLGVPMSGVVRWTRRVLVGMMRAHTAAKKLLSTPPENPIATRPYAKSSCSSADSLS